jgi:hypothetical protein
VTLPGVVCSDITGSYVVTLVVGGVCSDITGGGM